MEIEMSIPEPGLSKLPIINGTVVESSNYAKEHGTRINWTINKLRNIGAQNVVEVGGHPWVATSALIDRGFNLQATISAEEVTKWPDELPVKAERYEIQTANGNTRQFWNYSANVERTLFPIDAVPDTVLACEVVEHLIRAPHVMFLNVNHWLKIGGKLVVTTPNGAAFVNPFHHRSPTAPYRCHCYERHSYLFTLPELNELLQLCGFRIVESGYCDMYARNGLTKLYSPAASLPLTYFKCKFRQVIYSVAEKMADVSVLDHRPSIYDEDPAWEYIAPNSR